MRKLIIASAVAIATTVSFGISAASADVILRLGDGQPRARIVEHHDHGRRHHESRHHHRHHHRHHARKDCYTKRVVYHHHGRKVIKEERICR